MKCFIRPQDRLNKRQLKAMEDYSKLCAHNVYEKRSEGQSRRNFKLWCVALNAVFKFGKRRLGKVMNYIAALADEYKQDELFWRHIDNIVIDQMGLDFSRENYDELED